MNQHKYSRITDNQTTENQIIEIEKEFGKSQMMGILWMVIGPIWLTLSVYSMLKSELDFPNIGKVIVGISFILIGFYNLYQASKLKKKKEILQTGFFKNELSE